MASTSEIGIENQKFDGKNFALWKEMTQDMLIIRRQVKVIRHSEKPALMTIDEWKSIDDIAGSTIRMHLAKNVYFSMAKETTNPSRLREAILLIETHTDSKTVQYENERN